MRWDVLNHIAKKISAKRYLEIGVSDGTNLRRIEVQEKWGVDPFPQTTGVSAADVFVPKTSWDFFRLMRGRMNFDLVFIDGDHRAELVYAEVHEALFNLSAHGVIVLHDCSPHTRAMQIVPPVQAEWTGDVWKAVKQLRDEGHPLRVINADYGIGVLIPAAASAPPRSAPPRHRGFDSGALTWEELEAHRGEYLGLVEPWEWEKWFEGAWSNGVL